MLPSKTVALSDQTMKQGTVSVVATVPLLPGYARFVSDRSVMSVHGLTVRLKLLGPDDMPVRNRDVVFIFSMKGQSSAWREVFSKTDISGEAIVTADFLAETPGLWIIRSEAIFGTDRVVVSDTVSKRVARKTESKLPEGTALLVLLSRSLYTEREERIPYGGRIKTRWCPQRKSA